jgi:predicted CopG family antitoxin
MRTTVTIDDDVYEKVKQIAEESGRTFGQVLSQLTRKGLSAERACETESVTPVFRIRVGAAMIPGNRSVVILDQGR